MSERADRVLAAITAALAPAGPEAAGLAARALVGSDLTGHAEFGTELLGGLAETAVVAPRVRPGDAGSRLDLDAGGVFAPLAAADAAVRARDLAARTGLAVVTVHGLGRLGRLAPYVRWLAEHGLVATLVVNAPAAVAPAGGRGPVLGTNPLAAALPVAGGPPLVVDTATSAVTQGAVRAAARDGRALPEGVARDADGRPTTDPALVHAIEPRGGSFGSAVGLVVEILVAGLTGASSVTAPPRAAVLVAAPTASGAADAGRALVEGWARAGGHVPGAGGGALRAAGPDGTVGLGPGARDALDRLAPGW